MRSSTAAARYRQQPLELVRFPEEEAVPESKPHLDRRTALYLVLKRRLGAHAVVGSDQFVYWNAADPTRCLAPDVFLRRGSPDVAFGSWKTWERGAPELAVEIVSEADGRAVAWDEKLARYCELGVGELVRFDAEARAGERLRFWDRRGEQVLSERVVEGDRAFSEVLGAWLVVAPADDLAIALRVVEGENAEALWPTDAEALAEERAARASAEAEAATARASRDAAERAAAADRAACEAAERAAQRDRAAREAAEARVVELLAELGGRGGG